jgi:phenylalanyl-tRNA synthetase beta subunit
MYTARIEKNTIEGENFIHGFDLVQGESVEEIYLIIIGTPEWEGYELLGMSHSGGITKEQLNAAYTELKDKLVAAGWQEAVTWDDILLEVSTE